MCGVRGKDGRVDDKPDSLWMSEDGRMSRMLVKRLYLLV